MMKKPVLQIKVGVHKKSTRKSICIHLQLDHNEFTFVNVISSLLEFVGTYRLIAKETKVSFPLLFLVTSNVNNSIFEMLCSYE